MSFDFVQTTPKSASSLAPHAPAEQLALAAEAGDALRDARVIHVNSTAVGGGVAEVLKSLTPLMTDCGPETDWMVIRGTDDFFEITKRLHNLLQGADGELSRGELERYVAHNENVARQIAAQGVSPDVWVLHDPQTLPLAALLPAGSRVIWVCHIDTTLPNRPVIEQLVPFMRQAHRVVVSLPHYAVPDLDPSVVRVIPPAIDPLLPKNTPRPDADVRRTLSAMGLDTNRPLMAQVSRFDYWKDPWGVIDAYREAKQSVPDVQLALLGVIEAKDDPEAFDVLETVRAHAGGDPDVHLYSDPAEAGELEVGAIQQGADVVIQKSLREGFGLTVTEAMWKGSPVIGGNCGGIRAQIADGSTGYLVDSPSECARRAVDLLSNAEDARRMGRAARESVRQRYLTSRLLADYLSLVRELAAAQGTRPSPALSHPTSAAADS